LAVRGACLSSLERALVIDTDVDPDTAFAERSLVVLRNLDVVLVVVSLAPAFALGVPKLGYALGAGGWVFQRLIAVIDRRWTRRLAKPMKQLMVNIFEAFGRIWLLAGVIVLAAIIGGRRDGLAATLVIFGAYSVAFAIKVISGPPKPRAVH
jgi:hypothetical protein